MAKSVCVVVCVCVCLHLLDCEHVYLQACNPAFACMQELHSFFCVVFFF